MWWKSKRIIKDLANQPARTDTNGLIKKLLKDRVIRWSFRFILTLMIIGLFADFIANDKPIYCKVDGKSYFPITDQYLVSLGLKDPLKTLVRSNWYKVDYEKVILAPIPYASYKPDISNMNTVGPFEKQNVKSARFRHLLGTDQNGRDVAAGLISGTRYAMMVGIIAMLIASIIGISLGLLGGYLGDRTLQATLIDIALCMTGAFAGIYWGIYCRLPFYSNSNLFFQIIWSIILVGLVFSFFFLLSKLIGKIRPKLKRYFIPVDQLILRFVEIVDSIPVLLLILAIIPVIKSPSIVTVMIIIGLVSWTGIARFVRAEVLKIRDAEYIQAARLMQFSRSRIAFRHILPNSISPVLIVIAFGMAGAILAEATISFLGLGLNKEQITWGYILNQAKSKTSAWWLAIFPGLAIFSTIVAFNTLGEGLNRVLNPK